MAAVRMPFLRLPVTSLAMAGALALAGCRLGDVTSHAEAAPRATSLVIESSGATVRVGDTLRVRAVATLRSASGENVTRNSTIALWNVDDFSVIRLEDAPSPRDPADAIYGARLLRGVRIGTVRVATSFDALTATRDFTVVAAEGGASAVRAGGAVANRVVR